VQVLISAKSVQKVFSAENHFVSLSAKRENSLWMEHAFLVIKSVSRALVLKIISVILVQTIRLLD
jgi:hypothetical protein